MKMRTGAYVQCKQAERAEPVHPGKEKAPERPYSSPPGAAGGQQESWSGALDKGGQA